MGRVQLFWNLSIWGWKRDGLVQKSCTRVDSRTTVHEKLMYVSITSVRWNSQSRISYTVIYSVNEFIWVRLFQYSFVLSDKKWSTRSFWHSNPSKNCQRLICQGHFDAFDVLFKILNHLKTSSNGLERFERFKKYLRISA